MPKLRNGSKGDSNPGSLACESTTELSRSTTEYMTVLQARRFRKMRKTTAMMGGLCEERSEKGRGGRKVEGKGQQQGTMEANYESSRTSQ